MVKIHFLMVKYKDFYFSPFKTHLVQGNRQTFSDEMPINNKGSMSSKSNDTSLPDTTA